MKSFSYGGVIMKKKHVITITAALAASMAMSVTAFGAPTDIQGHWAQNTINKWVDKGDISGYPDGTFRPNNMITRAEFVVLVNNAMGYSKAAMLISLTYPTITGAKMPSRQVWRQAIFPATATVLSVPMTLSPDRKRRR